MLPNYKIRILLIEDETFDVSRVKKTISPYSDKIKILKIVSDGKSALDELDKNHKNYDVIIMDYQIVGGITGETLIKKIKEIDPAIQIIVITKMTINVGDYDFANALIEAGAMWYCTKYPADIEDFIYQPTDFILSILNAFEKKQLEKEKNRTAFRLKQNVEQILEGKKIIGQSKVMRNLMNQIARISIQDPTVMIYGESGTGKELVASHLHYKSSRKFEKFVAINCGSLPDNLIESELFGFEKGSFTGAAQDKQGLFELADNGTLFLDEIGELPLSAQAKLLRVLQDGEIDKIGRTRNKKVNVRIIAATNKDLQEAIKQKQFREDLFYRLNVVTINVPPLRERKEDLLQLSKHFLNIFSEKMKIDTPELTKDAIDYLQNYSWPGNVRQLQNVLQRILFIYDKEITVDDIRQALKNSRLSLSEKNYTSYWGDDKVLPWRDIERKIKTDYFKFVREKSKSDAEAANLLGLAPPNFHRMCKELGIK